MKKQTKIILILITFIPTIVFAHPGKTDANGCHYCRTNCAKWGLYNGQYHCHNGGTGGSSSSNNTTKKTTTTTKRSTTKRTTTSSTTTTTTTTTQIIKNNDTTIKEIIIDDISFQNIEDIYYTTKNSSVDIKVILNDEKAEYSINGNLNLNTGENTITIIVTAEDESTKEYKFIITKEEDLKSNTNIKAYINEDTINFYNNKATYTVKTDQESVSIECIPDNDNAIINIDNPNPTLNYGDNIINIHITAEDQTTNNYKLTIYRPKPPKEEKSSIIEKIIPPIFLTSIGYIIFKKKKK